MGSPLAPPRARRSAGWTARIAPALLVGLACASAPPHDEVPSAESYYQRGLKTLEGRRVFLLFRDVDYSGAIELFQEVIDNYPYSDYATLAELKIADVYFEQKRFEEAASYYQDFVELHPKHPQVSYAVYRAGDCAFRQMRDEDRDQTPTRKAVAQFRFLLEEHPTSEYAAETRRKLAEAEDRLAASVLEIGDFYFRRGHYYAAASRYREALDSYPAHRGRLKTLYRLALSVQRLGQEEEARRLLGQILESGPDEDMTEKVEEMLHSLDGEGRGS